MAYLSPTNLAQTIDQITEYYHPKHALTVNGTHSFKIAKINGPFMWHSHPETDEVFYVVSGGPLKIEMATNHDSKHERDGYETIILNAGDLFSVPRGYRHRPVAETETGILLVEKVGTTNTGDEEHSEEGHKMTRHVNEETKI